MDSAAVDKVIGPEQLPSGVHFVPNDTGRHFVGGNNAHIEKFGHADTILASQDSKVSCEW